VGTHEAPESAESAVEVDSVAPEPSPEPAPEPAPAAAPVGRYQIQRPEPVRCGGHVLTERGWVLDTGQEV